MTWEPRPSDINEYYLRLGVNHDATPEQIKKAFRSQSHKWHPDINKSPDAEAEFKAINEAYQVLSDSSRRRTYDQYGFYQKAGASPSSGNQDYSQKRTNAWGDYSFWKPPVRDVVYASASHAEPSSIEDVVSRGINPNFRKESKERVLREVRAALGL